MVDIEQQWIKAIVSLAGFVNEVSDSVDPPGPVLAPLASGLGDIATPDPFYIIPPLI